MNTDPKSPTTPRIPLRHHAVVVEHAAERAAHLQLMIGQNRQAIHALTSEIHRRVVDPPAATTASIEA